MANKEINSVADSACFKEAFRQLGEEAKAGDDLSRLLAIDLVVRISMFVRKIRALAKEILTDALANEIPSLSLISDPGELPQEAKLAEIRENVAIALNFSHGDWVEAYLLRSLAQEDRSQRCRVQLLNVLSLRQIYIDKWLSGICEEENINQLSATAGFENAASRLKDISLAMADVIRRERTRLKASPHAGLGLARLCRALLPLRRSAELPKKLSAAAVATAALLDEILSVDLTLMTEAESYDVVETFQNWWRPIPYPRPVAEALSPIVTKVVTAITLRARWGQRSEPLASRLRQALGPSGDASKRLREIADEETGLHSEIDDWLRGRSRSVPRGSDSTETILTGLLNENITEQLALIFLVANDALHNVNIASKDDLANNVLRLATAIRTLATQRGLKVVGRVGEIVEFAPAVHETIGGTTPTDHRVRIVRPMVIRESKASGSDVIVKAFVQAVT